MNHTPPTNHQNTLNTQRTKAEHIRAHESQASACPASHNIYLDQRQVIPIVLVKHFICTMNK